MNRLYQVLSAAGAVLALWLSLAMAGDAAVPAGTAPERFYLANAVLRAIYLTILIGLAIGILWPQAMRAGTNHIIRLARRIRLLGPLLFSPLPLIMITIQTRPDLVAFTPVLVGLGLCLTGVMASTVLSPEKARRSWHAATEWLSNRRWVMRAAITRLKDAQTADKIHAAAVALILTASIAPRVANLGNVMLYDEAVTYLKYTESPWTALTVYDRPNNHCLHSLLVFFSTQLFGNSEAAIRLPAFLASILGLWAVYRLGVRLFNRHVALWALALAGLSPWLIEYSYNARGYTLIVWLTIIALERIVTAVEEKSGLAAFEGALVLAAFTIPITAYFYTAVVAFSIGLWAMRHLFGRGPSAALLNKSLLAVAAWVGLLYLNPFYWRWLHGLPLYPTSEVWLSALSQFTSYLSRDLFALSRSVVPAPVGIGVLVVVLGLALARLLQTRPVALGLVLSVILVPLALVVVQGLIGMDIPPPRTVMFLAPIIYILAAAGIYELFRQVGHRLRRARGPWTASQLATLSALAAVAIFGLDAPKYMNQFIPYDQRADYQDEGHEVKEIAHYLAQKVEPGDSIYVRFNVNAQIQYYLPPEVVAAHWDITDETHRVFFIPGIWATKDVFEQSHGDEFRFVGPVTEIGRDTIYLYERRDMP
jgi:hypothetical protein